MRKARTMLLSAMFAAILSLVAAGSAHAVMTYTYADEVSSYTGWASIETSRCVAVVAPDSPRPGRVDPYCSVTRVQPQCFAAPCPPINQVRGVWAYSFDHARWQLLAPNARVHVYASSRTSQFAWIWTARTGFLAAPKRFVLLPQAPCPTGMVCAA